MDKNISMMEHVFIINPIAGKGKAGELREYINRHFNNVTIVETEYEGHGSEVAKEYAGDNRVIYSLGGDGTFNEVVNGVMASGKADKTFVANVPCGSGNDFLKDFSDLKDPKVALHKYKHFKTKQIDVGKLNGRYFVNISSVGFDAEIVAGGRKFKRIPFVSAELAYIISVFVTLIGLKGYEVQVQVDDGEETKEKLLFLTMANGRYYGGGMKVAPDAVNDDGFLNFCIIDIVKRRQVPLLLPKYMKGKKDELKVAHSFKGKKIKITSEKPVPINCDGEVFFDTDIEAVIGSEKLNILVP